MASDPPNKRPFGEIDLSSISSGRRVLPTNECSKERAALFDKLVAAFDVFGLQWAGGIYEYIADTAEEFFNLPKAWWETAGTQMFTQQHYEKTADLINSKRLDIQARLGRDYLTSLEITTLNDLTMGFVAMFRKDNPKFKELIFIERCNRDLHENS